MFFQYSFQKFYFAPILTLVLGLFFSSSGFSQEPSPALNSSSGTQNQEVGKSAGFGNGGKGFGTQTPTTSSDSQEQNSKSQDTKPSEDVPAGKNVNPSEITKDSKDKKPTPPKTKEDPDKPQGQERAAAATTTGGSPDAPEKVAAALFGAATHKSVNGSFIYRYTLDVPEFRGLEPKIILNYSSTRKRKTSGRYQGWLGHGWGMSGFDLIQRASRGKGAPYYNSNDVFLLNGEELVVCQTGTVSPSCSAGGTHATENESYQRITRDEVANTWTITNRVGTRSIFRPVAYFMATPPTVDPELTVATDYRWLLEKVIDTRANEVVYDYTCTDAPTCMPNTIVYNQTTIQFYNETRPDPITHATGLTLATIDQRIKSVKVTSAGSLQSVLALSYDQSSFSSISQLSEVTVYGTDAVVSVNGTVTSGSSLPPVTFNYTDTATTFTQGVTAPAYLDYGLTGQGGYYASLYRFPPSAPFPIDINGDGIQELYSGQGGCRQYFVTVGQGRDIGQERRFSKANGFFLKFEGSSYIKKTIPNLLECEERTVGHGEGGEYEEVFVGQQSEHFGYFESLDNAWIVHFGGAGINVLQADANYNFTKIVCPNTAIPACSFYPPPTPSFTTSDSNYDGLDEFINVPGGGGIPSASTISVDINGDGKRSIVYRSGAQSVVRDVPNHPTPFGPNGPNFTQFSTPIGCSTFICNFADVNGDGATDYIRIYNGYVTVSFSTGKGFAPGIISSLPFSTTAIPFYQRLNSFGDLNGDGSMELVLYDISAGNTKIISLADGTVSTIGTITGKELIPTGDLDGDGQDDLINRWLPRSNNPGKDGITPYYTNGSVESQMSSVANGYGGVVSVAYEPSSKWDNQHLPIVIPTVTSLSVDDGRGQVSETNYTYSGGKYDRASRKFLGFEKVIETKPLANGETDG